MTAASLAWNDYRALVEQIQDHAMLVLDLSGQVTSSNRGAQQILGYEPDALVGKHVSCLYPDEDVQSGKPEAELALARSEGHLVREGFRQRANGTRFWASVSLTLLRDEAGEPRRIAQLTRDVTERRAAQDALRISEERFRLLVEGVTDYAIYLLDPRGNVASWNSGAQKIKGYQAEQIIGRDFSVFFTEEDRAAGRPRAELEVATTQGRFAEEGWRVRSDGSRFWANVVVTALRDPSGELVGFSKITRDLTERRQAEETAAELQQQQVARAVAEASELQATQERERYRVLSQQQEVILEGVVDGITVQDRTGKVIFANSAAARLMGLPDRDYVVSQPAGELIKRFEMLDEHGFLFPPERLPGRRVLAGEPQASALVLVREKNGGRQWWSQIRANAVLDERGRPALSINIWHDVSQQRRQEEQDRYLSDITAALGKSLDYQATLESIAARLVPGLADFCSIHLLDGSKLRAVAMTHADPRKRKWVQEYRDKYPPNPDEAAGVWQVIRSGQPILHEQVDDEQLRGNARDEEHHKVLLGLGIRSIIFAPIKVRDQVSGTLTLIAAESGRRYDSRDLALATELGRRVGTFVENSQLFQRARVAAQRAEAAAREAEAAGRLKDEFLATVSHELRTPLNAIMGWSTLLKTRSDAASVAKGIEVIYRNAHAQSKIIEDILDVSRIITGKLRLELRAADLGTIVGDSLEGIRASASARDISVELAKPDEPSILVGDAERLQQVMWNLLSNAVKFTERGGHVRVTLERSGSQFLVSVADDGRGIEPEFLPYVFDRFQQADSSTTRRFGGLGLGLAIVRHIVELHGGRVSVRSAGVGAGATFEIALPIHATAPTLDAPEPVGPASPRSEPPPPRRRLDGVSLLVVDDEADARDLLEVVLAEAGARVSSAGSASAAFARALELTPDVIVSDIGMPEEDGYSLMRRIRSAGGPVSAVPAIALTAYTRKEDHLRALSMGFSAHVGKPVKPAQLIELVAILAKKPGG